MEVNKIEKVNKNLANYIVSSGEFIRTEYEYKYVGRRFRYFTTFDEALGKYLSVLERMREKTYEDKKGVKLSKMVFNDQGHCIEHVELMLDMI